MAEDVVRLLDHLKIDKAHLVGYSMGSILAGKVVAMHPERVLSVVFAGGAPVLEWDPTDLKQKEAFLSRWEKDKGLQALTNWIAGQQDVTALAAANRSLQNIRVTEGEKNIEALYSLSMVVMSGCQRNGM
jgi:pimeloyl-ACP methyl ester carboxylesterase